LGISAPEDLIPDSAQQGSQKQTGSDAKSGGDWDSHDSPFTLSFIVPELPAEFKIRQLEITTFTGIRGQFSTSEVPIHYRT
jgi:hypothetical protein